MFRKSVSILALVVFAFFVFGAAPAAGQPPAQSWEKVFTAPLEGEVSVVWALEAFDNNLYTAVACYPTGVQVYRSPDGSNWKAVSEPGFGIDPRLYVSWDMFVYKGDLYMGAHDLASHEVPGRIMRSRDGLTWETVFVVDESGFPGRPHAGNVRGVQRHALCGHHFR